MDVKEKREKRLARHQRVRKTLSGTKARPRLCVFRSNRYIYCQLIDDVAQVTLAQASSAEKELAKTLKSTKDQEAAAAVGRLIAERAKALGITSVVFDRGGYRYHGRVKALAEAAREAGLEF